MRKFGDVNEATSEPAPLTPTSPDESAWNVAPRAVADGVRMRRDGGRVIRVLRNDTDADGDRVRLVGIVRKPQNGRASVRADGTILYRPRAGFVGRDTLIYRIADGRGGYAHAGVLPSCRPRVGVLRPSRATAPGRPSHPALDGERAGE